MVEVYMALTFFGLTLHPRFIQIEIQIVMQLVPKTQENNHDRA